VRGIPAAVEAAVQPPVESGSDLAVLRSPYPSGRQRGGAALVNLRWHGLARVAFECFAWVDDFWLTTCWEVIHLGQTALTTTFRLGGWGYRGKDWPGLGDQSIPGARRVWIGSGLDVASQTRTSFATPQLCGKIGTGLGAILADPIRSDWGRPLGRLWFAAWNLRPLMPAICVVNAWWHAHRRAHPRPWPDEPVLRALAFLRDRLLEGVPELSYAHLVAPVVTPDVVAPVLTDSMAGEACSGWGLFYAGIAMFGEWPAPVLRRTSRDNNLLEQMVHNMGLLVAELVAPGALAGRDDVLTVPVLDSSSAEGVRRRGAGRNVVANELEHTLGLVAEGRFPLNMPGRRVRTFDMLLADALSRWGAGGAAQFWFEVAGLVIQAPVHAAELAGPLVTSAAQARAAARVYRGVVGLQRRWASATGRIRSRQLGLPGELRALVTFVSVPPPLVAFADPVALRSLSLKVDRPPLHFLFRMRRQALHLLPLQRCFGHGVTARAKWAAAATSKTARDGLIGCDFA
jgi:hypothetical protein